MIAARPTGPAPNDGDDVALLDRAVEHADLVAGRQDVAEHRALFGAHALGERNEAVVGEGDSYVLGLRAVDEMAEDPADAAERLAMRGQAGFAVVALMHLLMQEMMTRSPTLTFEQSGPTSVTTPTPSWPRIRPSFHGGDVTLEDVQVGSADRRRLDLDDRVGRLMDGRLATSSHDLLPGP